MSDVAYRVNGRPVFKKVEDDDIDDCLGCDGVGEVQTHEGGYRTCEDCEGSGKDYDQ